jgi:hypothetical protein
MHPTKRPTLRSRSRQRPRPAGFRHPHGTARSPGCLINPAALFASLYPSLLLSKLMKNQGHASVGRLGVLPLFPPVPPHPRSACGADVSPPVPRALRSRSRSRRCPTSGSASTYPRPLPEPFDPAAGTLKSSPEHVHVRSRSAMIRLPAPCLDVGCIVEQAAGLPWEPRPSTNVRARPAQPAGIPAARHWWFVEALGELKCLL